MWGINYSNRFQDTAFNRSYRKRFLVTKLYDDTENMMLKKCLAAVIIGLCVVIISCNKKQQPQNAITGSSNNEAGVVEKKLPVRRIPKVPVAKLIIVDDRTASKTLDGRLYYDLEGHRYWKNYNDGKYYLYNQSMYTDKAFKPH